MAIDPDAAPLDPRMAFSLNPTSPPPLNQGRDLGPLLGAFMCEGSSTSETGRELGDLQNDGSKVHGHRWMKQG
jgi:hypothetical protein